MKRSNSVFFTALTLLAGLALVAGCSDTMTPSDSMDFCVQDDECPYGQFCEGGVCSAGLGPCAEFDACPAGQICRHGACVADGSVDGGSDGDGSTDGGGDQAPGGPDVLVVSPPLTGDPPAYQLNFGNVAVGVAAEQQVVLENTGDQDLRILQLNFGIGAGNEDFSVPQQLLGSLPLVLAPGEQAAIDVIYLAIDGLTDHGVLDIISNDPDEPSVRIQLLSEFKGEQRVQAAPSSLAFGDVPLGDTSQPLTVTISNQGTGNAVLSVQQVRFGIQQNPDFALELLDVDGQAAGLPALLNTGDVLDAVIRYHPQAAGPDADDLVIVSDDPLTASLSVPISGTGVIGTLTVDPSPIGLGPVRVGQSTELLVTISNSGGAPLELTGVALNGVNADWSLSSADLDLPTLAGAPHPLGPGASATVLVGFAPSAAGASSGSLVIDHTGPAAQTSVALSAQGFVPPALELVPDPPDLFFGDVQLDAASAQSDSLTLPLTLRNVGGDPLRVTAIARAAGTSLEYTFQPASIPPIDAGQEAVLNVSFRPQNTGDEIGMLLVDTNDPDIAFDGRTGRFAVNMQARGTDPFIFVSPAAAHNFGVTNIAEHKSLDVTVRNASSFPLRLTNIRLTAGSSIYFTLSDLPALPMIIPDSLVEVHFTVNYDPAQVGQHTGAVEILSSDIGNPVVTIALSGDCQGCPAGTADCNPGVPGCETNITNDDSNCGACGIVCQDVNGTNTCANRVCQPVCNSLWGDCDSSRPNGCETPTNTLSNCGSCGQACNLPHATETCASGTCQVQACDAGYSDCTGAAGCETHTYQDINNCGACGNACTNAHGSTQCVANVCTPTCAPLWGNCDGDPDDGCETATNTMINCGTCGQTCALANATESCASGTCLVTACDSGWCNQDTLHPNGCEYDLDVNPTCGGYTNLGTVSGDERNDHLTYTAHNERWFRMRVAETYSDPVTCRYLSANIVLDVPAGTNYDLYVYCDNCTSSAGSSTAGGSTDELVNIRWDEGCIPIINIPDGGDDGRYVYIKVQFADANTCADWILHVYGNTPVSSNTCSTP